MKSKTFIAVISTLILLGTIFTATLQAGATKIDTTASGAGYIDIVFPDGGGYSNSASIKVPFNVYVLEALLALEGKASPFNGNVSWKTKADLMKGLMNNITYINGNLVLDKLFKNWTSPDGWSGADMKNLTLDQQKAILVKLVGTYFLPSVKLDPDGIGSPDMSDMAIDKNGNIHVIYLDFSKTPLMVYLRSSDGGNTWTTVKTFNANGFLYPHIYLGPNGYIHIFYNIIQMGGAPLLYQRSKDNGTTFESVAWTFKPKDVRVAFDAKGVMHFAGIVALFYPPFENKIYYWNSTDNGTTQGKEILVSDDIDNLSMKDYVNIAIDSKNKVHIIWQDFRNTVNGDDGEVFYSSSKDHVTFSQNMAIEGRTAVFGGYPDIVIDAHDLIHVVWADNSLGDQEVFYTCSLDGGGHFVPAKTINTITENDQAFPSLSVGKDESVQIVWISGLDTTQGDMMYSRSDDHGATFSDELIVNELIDPTQQFPKIVVDNDGMPNVIWADTSSGSPDIYYTKTHIPFASFGEITGIADLGVEPAELIHILVTASAAVGTEVRASIRTSTDNMTWSQWEDITLDDETFQSPAGRYVDYHILLLSKDTVTTPSATSIKIDYTQYMFDGVWTSDAVIIGHGVKDVTLSWTTTHGSLLTVLVSNDNGTTWSSALKGQIVTFPTVKDHLKVKALFTSLSNETPELSEIKVAYSSSIYPTDLSLDLGLDGTIDWNMTGELTSKVQLNITKALGGFLKTYQGGVDPVPVAFKFSSKTAGILTVSNISILIDLPPVLASWLPVSDTPQAGQGSTMTFKVVATDPDGKALNYKWTINGTEVPNISGPEYVFNASFDDIGTYVVKVVVSDGRFDVSKTWTLGVSRTNRAPKIISVDPTNASLTRYDGIAITFTVTAMDPDNDVLTYSWNIDGTPVPKATGAIWTFDYKLAPAGKTYKLQVVVSDGQMMVNRTWNMTVIAYGMPKIDTWTPVGNTTIYKGKSVDLGVVATHPDGLGVAYSWYINGQLVSGAGLKDHTFEGKKAGTYTVKVVVTDGKREVDHSWTVTVKEKASKGSSLLLWYGLGAVLVIVAAMVGVMLFRRSGKKAMK